MTDSTGPTTIAPRPWRRHGVFVSDCEQTLANMFIVRDAKNRFVGAFDRVADAVVCTDAVNLADKPESRPPHLDPRELATVLAGLRFWQIREAPYSIQQIATDGGTLEGMSNLEIDALCERLNTSPDPLAVPCGGAPHVLIAMDGGVVQSVDFEGGACSVEIRDFDTEGSDAEDLPKDDNGQPFYRSEYAHAGDPLAIPAADASA